MDKFKELSAQQADFMTLSFFSFRFGIKEGFLEWGIKKVMVDNCAHYSPIVKINGTANTFIDIKQDKLCCSPDVFGRHVELLSAEMLEEKDAYVFSADKVCLTIRKTEMEKLYDGKFLTPEDVS